MIGALLAVFAAVMRRNLQETDAFEEARKLKKPTGSIRGLLNYPRELLLVVGLTAGGTAAFYTFTTYMQTFVRLSVGLTEDQTTLVIFGSLIFATLLQPIYGALSDRIGRKPLLLAGAIGFAIFTYPLFMLLNAGSLAGAIAAHAGLAALESVFVCASLAAGAELFSTRVRSSGYSIGYNTSVAMFGGTAPYVATWLVDRTGSNLSPALYVVAAAVVTLLTVLTMRETARQPLRMTADSTRSAPLAVA